MRTQLRRAQIGIELRKAAGRLRSGCARRRVQFFVLSSVYVP
ncbi:MAG: hypothetical protein ACYDEU_06225 [Vulcanimicrobiaceae bacterium]